MFKNSPSLRRAFVASVLLFFVTLVHAQVRTVNAAMNEESQAHQTSIRAQAQIDQLSEQTADLLGEYRLALQRLNQARIYNQNLAEVVADQERAMSEMGQKIDNYERSKQDLVPLMLDMIDTLDRFVELDLPFALEERRDRVARLQGNMNNSEITNSEKFRQVMEAYQIEMDFGRTIDADTGWLEANGPRREVNFLRIGRMVLAYQTHDRTETGFFNPVSRQWELLPDEYRNYVTDGLRIAQKQAAPDLIRLPVPAPEAAQ
ncbi:MAG: DUF3450 domain-containing protein [Gammaproteobacteria bacterium]|nr:DUF3450 domain-containing protein [Gammaproteobacteria bacterium]